MDSGSWEAEDRTYYTQMQAIWFILYNMSASNKKNLSAVFPFGSNQGSNLRPLVYKACGLTITPWRSQGLNVGPWVQGDVSSSCDVTLSIYISELF